MGALIPKHSPPVPLSVESLQSAQKSLESGHQESDEMLSACLDHALRQFACEPQCLRDNATLTVQVEGKKKMEFVSGRGENKILVSWLRRKICYNIEVSNLEVYLGRLSLCPAPLSPASLEKVRQELARWDDATKELRSCLDVAITEIVKEPPSVKCNAELTIECGSSCLDFISGKGKSHIYTVFSNRQPQYRVQVPCVDLYLDRLSSHALPLTSENLLKVWKGMDGLKGCTVDLRACLKRALQEFNALSPWHRANATIFIDCDGKTFKMVSGQGESWVSVINVIGDQHCRREVVLALVETGPSSLGQGPSTGRAGKEGPLFRVRKIESWRSAEEGPSNLVRRTAIRPKGFSNGKPSRRTSAGGIGTEEETSESRKRGEETSFVGRTISTGKRPDPGGSNCPRAQETEYSLRSSEERKQSNGRNGKEREPANSQSLSKGTTEKEILIHVNSELLSQETGKETAPSSGSSEEEGPPDLPAVSSESKQADDGTKG